MALEFIPRTHPLQRVNAAVRANLEAAQKNVVERAFSTAADLCGTVLSDLKIAVTAPNDFGTMDPRAIADQPFASLVATFLSLFIESGIPEANARLHAVNVAQRIQLVRGFENPDEIVEIVTAAVESKVRDFPRTAADMERGRNPGDVLDPFILTAAQTLLYGGDFTQAVGATVAHKALMIIEGLMGHLHEDVIGLMRGNVRAPEPRGYNQEIIDPETNPFPGADLVQPPTSAEETVRFHQVKSKTGSAKGGDGKRLGDQLKLLETFYRGEVYYDALIGNTLRGHRSMGAVRRAAPNAVVLVGAAAFESLTRSKCGPELLLRVYQTAFAEAAIRSGYTIEAMTLGIVDTFKTRAEEAGDGLSEAILRDSTDGPLNEQDSRHFVPIGLRLSR